MASMQYGGIIERVTTTATAAGTTTFINTSTQIQVFTGSTTQTIVLPDCTTFTEPGAKFELYNQSSGTLTLQFFGGASFTDAAGNPYNTLSSGNSLTLKIQTNGTTAGTWSVQSPEVIF